MRGSVGVGRDRGSVTVITEVCSVQGTPDGGWGKCRSQGDGCGWLLELLRKQSRQKYERQGRAENGCRVDGGAGVQRTTGSGRDGGSEELT